MIVGLMVSSGWGYVIELYVNQSDPQDIQRIYQTSLQTRWSFEGFEEGTEGAYTRCYYDLSPGIRPFFERLFYGYYAEDFYMLLPSVPKIVIFELEINPHGGPQFAKGKYTQHQP
ncbi:MAG: hypothetical protein N2450_07700 [bacterium]|nr:hypothetical protein [bacterium]